MSISLENLRRDTRTRLDSDQLMTTAWILVPLLEIISAIVFIIVIVAVAIDYGITAQLQGRTFDLAAFLSSPAFLGSVAAFSLIILLLSLAFAYMVYKLIKRRNTHFARQLLLYEDLTTLAGDAAAKKGVDILVSLNNLKRFQREAWVEETEKNAVLWVILTLSATTLGAIFGLESGASLLPTLAILYVFYFLMKDFFNHERREDSFIEELNRVFVAAGITTVLPQRMAPIPNRSFILYVVLTIVTVGFFGVYWVYTLISDVNSHFRHQALTEDTVVGLATPIMT